MNKLLVPQNLKIGFNKRQDTYTGLLGFITYYKGTEAVQGTAWMNWIDQDIPINKFKNDSTSGFVINKNVGSYISDFGMRDAYIRVYDPRNFEFEISVPNLLFILKNSGVTKGGELEGEFKYAWSIGGGSVILLPVDSNEYKSCEKFTEVVAKKVSKRTMKTKNVYSDMNGKHYTYLADITGFEDRRVAIDVENYGWNRRIFNVQQVKRKYLLFINDKGAFCEFPNVKELKQDLGATDVDINVDALIQDFLSTHDKGLFNGFSLKPLEEKDIEDILDGKVNQLFKVSEGILTRFFVKTAYKKWDMDWPKINISISEIITLKDVGYETKNVDNYWTAVGNKQSEGFKYFEEPIDLLKENFQIGSINFDNSVIKIKQF